MNESDWVEEAAEEDERPTNHTEPREPVVERIVAVDSAAAVAGVAPDAAATAAATRRVEGRRGFGLVATHFSHQIQPLAQLVQTPAVDGPVLIVLHLHRHYGATYRVLRPANKSRSISIRWSETIVNYARKRKYWPVVGISPAGRKQIAGQRGIRSVRKKCELERHLLPQLHRNRVGFCIPQRNEQVDE